MRTLAIVLFILLCWASRAEAACSGSGTTWTCTAGTTAAQVNSTLSAAANNATLTFDAGSYNWSSDVTFLNGKGATLICASVGGCTVTGAGIHGMNGTCAGNTTDLQRISGFVFSGGSTRLWYYGPTACNVTKLRVDHNTFTGQSSGAIIIYNGESASVNNFIWGVIDHNTVTNAQSVSLLNVFQSWPNTPATGSLGSDKNMFLEDNTFTITTQTDTGGGIIDGWSGMAVVTRFNTIQNSRIPVHGSQHGFGPINYESYYNTIRQNANSQLPTGYRSIHHQGSGTMMVFENVIAQATGQPHDTDAMAVLHSGAGLSRSGGNGVCDGTQAIDGNRASTATYRGYPCFRGPGRDADRLLYPMYAWRNRWADDGSKINLICDNAYSSNTCTAHIIANRDLFNAVSGSAQTSPTSPFNGTTGMGFGTLANRPTTCSVGPDSGPGEPDAGRSGVGYWATDQGDWRTDNGATPDGQLYICTATNTWKLWYTPYTYPHPLVTGGGGGGGGDVTPPSAPTNLRVQ
jgi:hypothetical protein